MISRAGYSRGTENKVGVRIHITAVYADDTGAFHKCLAILKRQLDTILSGFHLESKPAGVVGCRVLPLAGLEVDHLHVPTFNRARPFRPANGSADRAVSLQWFGAEIDHRTAVACRDSDQSSGHDP